MLFVKLIRLMATVFPLIAFSQDETPAPKNIFRNEFSLVSDNDNYTFEGRDGYYTNGFYLKWSYAVNLAKNKWFKNKPSIKKVVSGFEAGQAIYNPISYNRPFPEKQDRPFAGYLTCSFDQHIFYRNRYKKTSVFVWGASLGTIGPDSYGKQVQRWYHRVIGIYDVKGWPYQVTNEWSLNLKAAYYVSPFNGAILGEAVSRGFEPLGFIKANFGNACTNAAAGILLRLGKLENLYNSSHFRARVSTANGAHPRYDHEIYVFYEPAVTYQVYNAVLQGGLFVKDKGPVTVSLRPVVFSQQVGMRYAGNRFTTALVYTNRTKEAVTQIRNENFVSIQLAYRFGKMITPPALPQ